MVQSDEEFNAWWAAEDNPGINWAAVCGWVCVLILIYILWPL